MKKIFIATKTITSMFIIDEKDAKSKKKLSETASEAVYLEACQNYHDEVTYQSADTIKEVCSLSEVPKDWREGYLYNSDDGDITPIDFFLGAFK
jgi:hypothetical protein